MNDVGELRELAFTTARKAGRMLVDERPEAGPDVVQTKSSPTDIVTQMDHAAEKLIIERISASRPDDGFLGEEGAASTGGSGVRWIVDPIDGTVNYLYDLPDWAVSIAAELDGEIVAGAIDIPQRGETFVAGRGKGAYLRREDGTESPVRMPAAVPLDHALIATGFGYDSQRRAHQADVLRAVLPRIRDIRRGGSCCVDLCAVATGRVDGYYERGPNYWDFAAGSLIVAEAGGRVEGLNGRPPSPELAMAAGPGLFEQLHDVLAQAGADTDGHPGSAGDRGAEPPASQSMGS